MSEREISVDLDELTRVEVYCPDCKTGILLDIGDGPKHLSSMCPCCGKDNMPEDVFMTYQRLFEHALGLPTSSAISGRSERRSTESRKATLKFRIKES